MSWMISSSFFNDTAATEIYTLSLHDALPISSPQLRAGRSQHGGEGARKTDDHRCDRGRSHRGRDGRLHCGALARSEEHTSELQSRQYLVCRLLLEKKKSNKIEE